MTVRKTIVRKCSTPSKAALHDLLMIGWQRCVSSYGKGTFADALGISTVAVDKQLAGSMPGFEHIVEATSFDPHVLDDVLAAMGKRVIDAEGEIDADDLSVALAMVLLWTKRAEHPDSPGGRRIVHSEIAEAETMLRQIHKITGDLLGNLADARKPRVVTL